VIETSVYFAQGVDGGPIKIGLSVDVQHRVRTLQSGSPVALDLLCSIPGTEETEATLHDLFASGRLHGEWFHEDTPMLAEAIEIILAPDLTRPRVAELHALIEELRS
jgi:hypothetical protein